MVDCAVPPCPTWTAREVLFPRSSSTAGSDDNGTASILPTSPSTSTPSPMTSATTTSTSDSDIDIPTIHSPVPMVAGSLAGFIAILAAVLVVVVLRRRKRQPISRTLLHSPSLPSCAGGNMSGGDELDDLPDASLRSAGRLRTSSPKSKRMSRCDYVTDDVELGHMDSGKGKTREQHSRRKPNARGRNDAANSHYSRNVSSTQRRGHSREYTGGRTHASLETGVHTQAETTPIDRDITSFSSSSTQHTVTSPTHAPNSSLMPKDHPSVHSTDPPRTLTDSSSFLLPPPICSPSSALQAEKTEEDSPPAYEDVR